MPETKEIEKRIFSMANTHSFNELAVDIFYFQYSNNQVYRRFVDLLGVDPSSIRNYSEIPFIPIEFFKDQKVVSGEFEPETTFISSGTTGQSSSRHHIKSLNLYEQSFVTNFKQQFGAPEDYILLALLPSYLEREGSSLVYMVEKLIELTNNPLSDFYLHDYEQLAAVLSDLKQSSKKALLIGVTYALLDLAEAYPMHFPELIVMETGGMKGRRKELLRTEMHDILKKAFGVENIRSEYGMTELLSQAYSHKNGIFESPAWMKVLIRDMNDPLTMLEDGQTGGMNIIDLANLYSCSFIATKDLGKKIDDTKFEMLGRYDNSDVRGCNLMIS
ncbi:MAG: acyltransferase [Bacteroidales bacterium]|jgi:phenylacetate-coenzyme A ligase PaaK-like adenylate-forming protein|nr:acyltransferase [Bacteroidales bacterium]